MKDWIVSFIVGFGLGAAIVSEIWRRIAWKSFQAAVRDLRAYEKLMKIRLHGEEDGLRERQERPN